MSPRSNLRLGGKNQQTHCVANHPLLSIIILLMYFHKSYALPWLEDQRSPLM